jgi:hypothetical protein
MAALISFYAGQSPIQNMNGSGLGFYGPSAFGASVDVGAQQDHTYITDAAGAVQGPEAWNNIFLSTNSGIIGQNSGGTRLNLLAIPNYQSTINVRFTYDSAVQVQNAQAFIYDRVNPQHSATGVTTKVAQVIHPDTTQTQNGSGDASWHTFTGSTTGQYMNLAPSPGISGLYAGNGSNSVRPDAQHDWYLAMSCSPDSIGSKTFGLYITLEYL